MDAMRVMMSRSIASARRLACSIGSHSQHQSLQRWTQHMRCCPVTLLLRTQCFHSDGRPPVKNPFEIQFDPEDEVTIFKASKAVKVQQPRDEALDSEIQNLHAADELRVSWNQLELADIFGEELEEYDGSGSSTDDSSTPSGALRNNQSSISPFSFKEKYSQSSMLQSNPRTTNDRTTLHQQAIAMKGERFKLDKVDHSRTPSHETNVLSSLSGKTPSVLVIHGPCSFACDNVIGTTKTKQALWREMHDTAAQLGIAISCHESNLEGEILDLLLNADPATSSILLCLNGPLSETPLIRRALNHLSDNQVILVSPVGIEHGPVPTSVQGVLTGFASAQFEIALQAAATEMRE